MVPWTALVTLLGNFLEIQRQKKSLGNSAYFSLSPPSNPTFFKTPLRFAHATIAIPTPGNSKPLTPFFWNSPFFYSSPRFCRIALSESLSKNFGRKQVNLLCEAGS